MEKKLSKIYKEAQKDIQSKWDQYMKDIKPEADRLLKEYNAAKASGDKDLIDSTGKAYGRYIRENTMTNKYYQDMLDQTTTRLANVNQTALSYLNGEMPSVYAKNYNAIASDTTLKGYSFDLVDESTVKNLIMNDSSLLPQKTMNIAKDKLWNTKSINSQVLQGVLQGESVDKIAKRLKNVTNMNKNAAIRNARTMTTGAECKGRMDSYKRAQENGIVMKKVWMASGGHRARDWHAALDRVEAEVDDPFENDYGKIMYPGDPSAHPSNVYNCRCSIKTKIIGFKRADGSISYIDDESNSLPLTITSKHTGDVIDVNTALDSWVRNASNIRRASNGVKYDPDKYIGNIGMNDEAKADVIENWIRSGNNVNKTIYRGISNLSDEDYAKLTNIGSIIDQKGISRWSLSESVATGRGQYGNSIVFVQEGTALGRELSNAVGTDIEQEVIMSKLARQEIYKVEKNKYTTKVFVKEVKKRTSR